MKYPEYKNFSVTQISAQILDFWKENQIFERSVTQRKDAPNFTFYEGPPSANGTPGIHHVMARAIKDIFCRYKTMQGYRVDRKGGWDTHGLPVELQVEKELGISKEDIGKKISIAEYNLQCKQTVMRFKDEWDRLTVQMGYWVDLQNPYITFENNYIESCWALLARLYDKNLLYKGYTIQPYSPAAGTGLSSHELNQPGCYRNVKDTSIIAQFKVLGSTNTYLLAWTTTPWTLPSNTALAVGKNIDYVKIKTTNQYTFEPIEVILAKNLLDSVMAGKYIIQENFDAQKHTGKFAYQILEEMKGSSLVGMAYEQLMPYVLPLYDLDKAFKVIAADFVSTEDGTGIVHLAPTFGADDFKVARQNGIPPLTILDENNKEIPLVDRQGRFVAQVSDYAGLAVKNYDGADEQDPAYKSTDVLIAISLKEQNKAFKVEKYEHSYPHCWRTDKPILYYPMESWFIRTSAYKTRMAELNKTINWKPESTGSGRFGNWLENLVDWNLSRSRYWGTPLPIWRTEEGNEQICIGSIAQLKQELERSKLYFGSKPEYEYIKLQLDQIDTQLPDLHRPYCDQIILVSQTGQPMYREADLIDVWFDSGAMPYAQWHFPFENQDIFEKSFPADFISEGVDQTRGWFFTLHALSTMLFDSVAFKNVVSTGLVLDKNGEKMSKRKGNVINPFEALDKYGPDATRWYMVANAPPWDNLKFSLEGLEETQRRFFGTLQNTYAFFALYSNLDNFCFEQNSIPLSQRAEADRWIISRLNTVSLQTGLAYQDYDPTRAARAIQSFVADELSNWYVRLNRKRFWKNEYNQDKIAAYQTLYTCLITVAKLMAPIAPFYAEQLFRDLNNVSEQEKQDDNQTTALSVHLAAFPKSKEDQIDNALEARMQTAQSICSLVHSLRKKENIKVRQPLQKILIPLIDTRLKEQIEAVKDLILSEINVKQIEYITDESGLLVKSIKPDFKKLGRRFGSQINAVALALSALSQAQIATFEKIGNIEIVINGQNEIIEINQVEMRSEQIAGWSMASEGSLTIALETGLTDTLIQEGIARDIINRLQNLRKEQGFLVQDKIEVQLSGNARCFDQAIANFGDYIGSEVQGRLFLNEFANHDAPILDIDDWQLKVFIVKL